MTWWRYLMISQNEKIQDYLIEFQEWIKLIDYRWQTLFGNNEVSFNKTFLNRNEIKFGHFEDYQTKGKFHLIYDNIWLKSIFVNFENVFMN
jgi:hypothetical protein